MKVVSLFGERTSESRVSVRCRSWVAKSPFTGRRDTDQPAALLSYLATVPYSSTMSLRHFASDDTIRPMRHVASTDTIRRIGHVRFSADCNPPPSRPKRKLASEHNLDSTSTVARGGQGDGIH